MRRIVGERARMNPVVGWGLAVAAVAAGWVGWRWQGVLLAVSVVVFWLLLQFSRAMRVLRVAGQRPKGLVDSALMLNSRLHPGLQMLQVVQLTRSLGEPASAPPEPEAWRWHDAGGDAVRVEFSGGRVTHWALERAAEPPAETAAAGAEAPSAPAAPPAAT